MAIMLVENLTAYSVLVKDIWTPVFLTLLPDSISRVLIRLLTNKSGDDAQIDQGDDKIDPTDQALAIILAGILFLSSPLLLQRDLYALRHTCYVGFSCCLLLMVAVVLRANQVL